MKKLIALRKLKRKCTCCNKEFTKGNVYYKKRYIYPFTDYSKGYETTIISTYEELFCAKCNYKKNESLIRFKEFQKICKHPEEFLETEYSYIPGECVKEPDYDYCKLCGEKF